MVMVKKTFTLYTLLDGLCILKCEKADAKNKKRANTEDTIAFVLEVTCKIYIGIYQT